MLLKKVERIIKDSKLYSMRNIIILALSGGADSVFLFYFFLEQLRLNRIKKLVAVHINHNLRKEAEFEESFCRKLCKDSNVKFYSFSEDVNNISRYSGVSVEEVGHNIRYEKFQKIALNYENSLIATAHHLNDQVETVLWNIVKGTGLQGLSGVAEKKDNIIRPLLSVSKKEILEYLDYNQYDFVTDKSNFDVKYKRNYIRHKIAPLFEKFEPSYKEKFLQLSQHSHNIDIWLKENLRIKDFDRDFWGNFYIKRSRLSSNYSILYYEISGLLAKWGLKEDRVTIYKQISKIYNNNVTGKIDLSSGKFLSLDSDGIRILTKYNKFCELLEAKKRSGVLMIFNKKIKYKLFLKDKFNYILTLQHEKLEENIVIEKDKFPIKITTREDGLKTKSGKKLKVLMIKNKLPNSLKEFWPILLDNNNVVINVFFIKRWSYEK